MIGNEVYEIIGAIIGGIISGAAGIAIASYASKIREKNEVKESVYAHLYNSLVSVNIEPFLDGYPNRKWKELESHKKLRASAKIKKLYDKYEKLADEHQSILVSWENEWHREHEYFEKLASTACIRAGLKPDKIPIKQDYEINLSSFLNWFRHILFDKNNQNSDQVYKRLIEFANIRYADIGKGLEKLHNTNPAFYRELFQELEKILVTFPSSVNYQELIQKRDELKKLILIIKMELENELK